jgi:hypothetical protein
LFIDQVLDQPANLAGPELGLGLPLELRLRELDRDPAVKRQVSSRSSSGASLPFL